MGHASEMGDFGQHNGGGIIMGFRHRYALVVTVLAGLAAVPVSAAPPITSTPLVAAQMTYWRGTNRECSGTLVTPRVMVTAGRCVPRGKEHRSFYLRAGGVLAKGRSVSLPGRTGPIGDFGIVMLEHPYPGASEETVASIPSYRQEYAALVDGNADLTHGTRLVAYVNDRGHPLASALPRRLPYYLSYDHPTGDGHTAARSLMYRSFAGYRAREPERLDAGSPHPLLSGAVLRLAGARGYTDADLDDALLLTAGLATDRAQHVGSPIREGDMGGGVFYLDGAGREWLVGSVLGPETHVRLSLYWPWVFDTLMRFGMRADAVKLARKVLGTAAWDPKTMQGVIGEIYVHDNPVNGAVEFFRRLATGKYDPLPHDRRDSLRWEYLGTRLPDAQQATTRFYRLDTQRLAAVGDIYVVTDWYTQEAAYYQRRDAGGEDVGQDHPIEKADSPSWRYLGSDLPARQMKGAPAESRKVRPASSAACAACRSSDRSRHASR